MAIFNSYVKLPEGKFDHEENDASFLKQNTLSLNHSIPFNSHNWPQGKCTVEPPVVAGKQHGCIQTPHKSN